MIEAHIVNVGWLHAGIPHGEQINFPADFETVQARLRKINALDGRHEIALSEYRSDIPGLAKRLDPYENLDELNYLAHLLTDMESADREKFAAAVAHGEYANSLEGLINLAYNLECYDLHRGVNDTEDLGRLRAEGRVEPRRIAATILIMRHTARTLPSTRAANLPTRDISTTTAHPLPGGTTGLMCLTNTGYLPLPSRPKKCPSWRVWTCTKNRRARLPITTGPRRSIPTGPTADFWTMCPEVERRNCSKWRK